MTTEKKFASIEHACAHTEGGDSNSGIFVGDDAVLVVDTQATRSWTAQRNKGVWQALEA